MNAPAFNEQQKLQDLLSCEKHMTALYNGFCNESATPAVKSCLCALLQDEHTMQNELFNEMSSRGWYPTAKAEDSKLQAAKLQFAEG